MASGGAGALLLRAAALGGLTAAAWLLSGTTASASPEEPPAVEIVAETPAAETPAAEVPQLLEDPAGWAQAFTASVVEKHQPTEVLPPPVATKPAEEEPQEEPDEGPVLDFTGGSHSNNRSGSITNEAPPEVVQAKAKVRAAKIAAKLAAELPPPPPPPPPAPVPVAKKIVPLLPDLPVPAPAQTEPAPASDYSWSAPGPDAPLPAPQQAPVVATASASSGHTDNSGGTRGVLAVLTSHDSLFPPTTWSAQERRDGTAPGSTPGLPATSPD
ncbi:hypothetical protein [Lentzea sp. NPDC003310]|uniref:hypothetical protein n=1 Tax=Lentzea sp. NPDC003310 TaxID=3154447 RepID=UPI0033B145CE